MKELIRANDPVMISWVVARLGGEGIDATVLDTNMSILDGNVTAIPRRVMVEDEDFSRAKRILDQARADGVDV